MTGTFFQGVMQGLAIGGIYGLITLALTAVYSVTRLLNFAHGDLMVVAMYLTLQLSRSIGVDPYLTALILAPAMFGLGLALFYAIFRPLLQTHVLLVIQVTLGVGFVIQSALMMIYSSNYQTVQTFISGDRIVVWGIMIQLSHIVVFVAPVVIAVTLYWLQQHTTFGREVRAVAEDAVAAALCGVNVRWVQMIVFAGAVGMLGLIGPMVAPVFVFEPTFGLHLSLVAFIVLILGGVTNFLGTFVAGLIIGLAESLGKLYMEPPEFGAAVPYLIFILFLLFRPSGVMGASR